MSTANPELEINAEGWLRILACRTPQSVLRKAAKMMTQKELEDTMNKQREIVGAADEFRNHQGDLLLILDAEFDARHIGRERKA